MPPSMSERTNKTHCDMTGTVKDGRWSSPISLLSLFLLDCQIRKLEIPTPPAVMNPKSHSERVFGAGGAVAYDRRRAVVTFRGTRKGTRPTLPIAGMQKIWERAGTARD